VGQAQHCAAREGRQVRGLRQQPRQLGLGLAVHGRTNLLRKALGEVERGQQPAEEADVAERDLELGQPDRAQRRDRERHDLCICGLARRADQLDADLRELVLAACTRRLVAEHAARIRDAQGERLVIQPRPDDARGGDGQVGPQREGAAVAVEEAVHLRVDGGADVGCQGVRILERR